MERDGAGQIVILNGPPRSGKSSIAAEIQERFEGLWMNLGVDHFKQMTRPGSSRVSACGQVASARILNR
jgi:chloramphenicol 3-O-phosphotransferase